MCNNYYFKPKAELFLVKLEEEATPTLSLLQGSPRAISLEAPGLQAVEFENLLLC